MTQYQLRMYRVKPGELDEWIAEWGELIAPLRRAAGFDVVGAWVDREENLFVWLVGHEDLERANEAYYTSPERQALDPDPARHLTETKTWILDPVKTDG